jgi:subtilisin-like proprotein convertase family protein
LEYCFFQGCWQNIVMTNVRQPNKLPMQNFGKYRFSTLGTLAQNLALSFLLLFLLPKLVAQTPCVCTNCPQFMPDVQGGNPAVTTYSIQIQGASNPTLGQNGQGVCGVRLHFEHEYIGDLRITLTSPSGQTVTLIGPVGLFGETDFSTWNILFVPCSAVATPDPTRPATWTNTGWPDGTAANPRNYTGSYYPQAGCLESFTGSVNGQWTLTATDGQALDVGTFFNYEIIFCDPAGIDCFSCAANAGALPQPDVTACEGVATLNLNLPPTFTPANSAPPSSLYSYTYVIAQNPGGIIQAYDPDANLQTYPPGSYTVCGMSYLTADAANIPAPNGSLTTAQLSTQLAGSQPPFCGRITTNCVNVTINAGPDDIVVYQELCAPACTTFFGQNYCATGTYVRSLTQNGCPYTATLILNMLQPVIANIRDTICEGQCSTEPGFPAACAPGLYTRTLTGAAVNGCDSIIRLSVTQLSINVNVPAPGLITCTTPNVTLQSTGSTPGTYTWSVYEGATGNIVGSTSGPTAVVNQPGTYELKICRNNPSGGTCCDSVFVDVNSTAAPPGQPGNINGPTSVCTGAVSVYSVPAVSGASNYTWTLPPGATITAGANSNTVTINWGNSAGGTLCVRANNACGPSAPSCINVTVNTTLIVGQPQGPTAVCGNGNEAYSVPPVPNATNYNWTITNGSITTGQGTPNITVLWNPGTTGNVCVQVSGGCGTSPNACLPVQISNVPATPNINGAAAACVGTTGTYTVTVAPGVTNYVWTVSGGTITGGNGANSVQVSWAPGNTLGSVCLVVENACGASNQDCNDVTLSTPPAQPVVSGAASVCAGSSAAYSIPAIPGATGYAWTVTGGTIVSGQNTTNLQVNWGNGTSGNVCVAAVSACGNGPQGCFPVTLNAVPNANAGSNAAICGTSFNLQATNSVANSTGAWTLVSGPGTAAFGNANSASTSVSIITSGAYTFRWTETNATCVDDATVTITFNASPSTGLVSQLCDNTNQNYTVSFPVSGGTAPYTIPNGTVSSGVFTSTAIPSGQPYTFTISDANGCTATAVTGVFNCNCSSAAGQMSLTPLSACEGLSVTAQHLGGQTLDGNDVAAYVLHSNAGTTLGTVFSQNTTGIFGFQPGMVYGTTYYVSYVVGNNLGGFPNPADPCRSVAQGQPVVFYQNPVANAGADAEICGLSLALAANAGNGTWSVPGNALTFSNVQSPTATATATAHGSYTLTWTLNNNGCTDTDEVVLTFNASPTVGAIGPLCDPANENYTISFPISGGEAPYSVNGTALVGNTFVSAAIPSGQAYNFAVSDANGCTAAAVTGSFNCNCSSAAGQMSLTPLSACEGLSVTAQHLGGQTLDANDVAAYVLHSNAGTSLGTVFSQNTTGIFGFQPGMVYGTTYYVSYVVGNNLGGFPNPADPCRSVAQGQPVVFYQNPVANAGADAEICGLSLALAANAGNGTWSVPGNALTFSNLNSSAATATATAHGSYTLTWTLDNNGCTDTDEVVLTFNASPTVGAIGPLCDPANENYTISFPISGGEAPYSVNGTALVGNTFVSAAIPSGQAYNFAVSDANGCTAAAVTGSFNCDCSSAAGQMSLTPLSACEGLSVTAQHLGGQTLDANDVAAYVLHSNAGTALGTVFAQNTTGEFFFQPGMVYGTTYYVSYVVGNNLGGFPNPADPCRSVAQGQPVVFYQNPVANAGADQSVCGLAATLGASAGSGQWFITLAPPGANLTFSDQQNPASNITADAQGTYTLSWSQVQNGCTDADVVLVTFNAPPTLTNLTRSCDPANENYTVVLTLGGNGPFTVNGAAANGNTYTSAPIPNGQSYNFAVADVNGCPMPAITGAFSCNCATDAGTMSTTLLEACEGSTVTASANNDQTLDGNDVVSYVLHNGAGPALGTVFAQNATGSFGFQPGMFYGVTYYISRVVGNPLNGLPNPQDPCFSVASGQPVEFYQNPTPDAGVDAANCGLSFDLQAVISTFDGVWAQVSGPGTANFAAASNPGSNVSVSLPGTYVFEWTETNEICVASDAVSVTFNELPQLGQLDETCNGTNTQYTVTLNVSGGTPPYEAVGIGGAFAPDTVFTSVPLANNSTYAFRIQDANGCETPDVTGANNCNCATDAGSMLNAPLAFCADQPAVATWNNDGNTDADDIVRFILHTSAGSTQGNILATANQPSFAFGNGLQTGTTYYISAIAGNGLNGNVDLNDPCLSVAPGTPVQWRPMPSATLSGDVTICAGSTAQLAFAGTGSYPLTATYGLSNGGTNTITIGSAAATTLDVAPAATTTYTLLSVSSGNNPTCTVTLNDPATVTVNQPVSAGLANDPVAFCEGTALPIQLSNLLTGADFGGQWSEVSATPSVSGGFNAQTGTFLTGGQPAGVYRFRYLRTALAPCPSSEATVEVVLHALPNADAGEDQVLDCNTISVTLGGFSTSSGTGITHSWTQNGAQVGSTPQLLSSSAGDYTLLVTNVAGCTATDAVRVEADNDVPTVRVLTVRPVRCFGERNGSIVLDSVASQHPPLLFSLNGGPFSAQREFSGLAPGEYLIEVQDARGCETTAEAAVLEPTQLLLDLGATLKVALGDSAILKAQLNVPVSALDTVLWEPLLDPARAGTLEQRTRPFDSGYIGVAVVDSNGCTANDRVLLVVDKLLQVYIPNIISINSAENNVLTVFGGQDVAEVESFQVFDRWGDAMFEQRNFAPNSPEKGWRGQFKGKDVNPGVYVYTAVVRFINGEKVLFKGDVTVFK